MNDTTLLEYGLRESAFRADMRELGTIAGVNRNTAGPAHLRVILRNADERRAVAGLTRDQAERACVLVVGERKGGASMSILTWLACLYRHRTRPRHDGDARLHAVGDKHRRSLDDAAVEALQRRIRSAAERRKRTVSDDLL